MLTDARSDVEEQRWRPPPEVPSQALERCDAAPNRTKGGNSCGPAAPDDRTQECLQTLDNGLAPAEQNRANADHAREQQRHVEVNERRGPVDPGDCAQAWRGLRASQG